MEKLEEIKIIKSDDFSTIAKYIINHTKLKNKNSASITTGITTAYNIGDNQLREFVFASKICKTLKDLGFDSQLILINDTHDAFSKRHLKLLNKFDPRTTKFSEYIGIPICNIPCPYGCHKSLAEHFHQLLIEKLNYLGIFPKELLQHKLYGDGSYEDLINKVLNNYEKIETYLKTKYGLSYPKGLFRIACQNCGRITTTHFRGSSNKKISYFCNVCKTEGVNKYENGKFTWKIDCALRWIKNDTDFEPFLKNYLTKPYGSYFVSSDLAAKFFEFDSPLTIQIEYIRYNKNLSSPTKFLPIRIVEELLLENFHKKQKFDKFTIIKKSKLYRYTSGMSFFQASILLGCLFQNSYKEDYLMKINDVVFKFPEDEKMLNKIKNNIELAINFFNVIIPEDKKTKLLPVDQIKTPKNKNEAKILLDFLNGKIRDSYSNMRTRRNNKFCKVIYRILFNADFGPSLDTTSKLITDECKNLLIDKMNSDNL